MVNREPPNRPMSPFDPRAGNLAFSSKIIREPATEARRHEKGNMCWCGNPNCPGDKVGGGRDAEVRVSDDYVAIDFGRFFERAASDALQGTPRREDDRAYQAAREKVKDYLTTVEHTTAWDDIVGNDTARSALMEAIEEPVINADLYKYYGMKPAKGVMLFGPPGCGKTMFAKAAAAAVGRLYKTSAEVLVVNGPSIQSPYVGVTEQTIRDIFTFARAYKKKHNHPLTVFIDEAEVLFPDRTGRTRQVMPWEESNVAQFLSEMDGLNDMGAFVILATNRPEAIDEALLRDGRCDRKIKVERPSRAAVEAILTKTLVGAPAKDSIADLVAAGVESFFNPHYVLRSAGVIRGPNARDASVVNFGLEHIVSGAMVVGVGARAKSKAFQRDRDSGARLGLTVADVVDAVRDIFEENKRLEHSFALQEFVEGLQKAEPIEKPVAAMLH